MRASGWRSRPTRTTLHGETPYSPTSLLRALTADPYQVDPLRAQNDPAAEPTPPDTPATRTVTLLLAIALGFTVVIAVADLRAEATSADGPRALLEQEVRDSRAEVTELETLQEELEGQIAEHQQTVLEREDSGSAERLAEAEGSGAAVAMEGPGAVLVLEDSAPLPSASGSGVINRVMDADVQVAVNGLWAAGAEAIAVNGQRISATSAIRTAGSAILVDFRPLSPPYRITALGDPTALQEAFTAGEAGAYFDELTTRYGISVSWEAEDQLTVPARPIGTLREAARVPEAGDQPAPDQTQEDPS